MSHWKPSQSVGALKGDLDKHRERTLITCIAEAGKKSSTLITCPTGTAAVTADFVMYTAKDGTKILAWLDKDDAGADAGHAPGGTIALTASSSTEVNVTTGQTAIQVAAAFKAALNSAFVAAGCTLTDNLDGTLTVTESLLGTGSAVTTKNSAENAAGTFVAALTAGVASVLQNKKMTILNAAAAFYAWFNVNGEGADPTGTGTGLEVALSPGTTGLTATQVATALAAALLAASGLFASSDGAAVYASSDSEAAAVDAGAGNTGFTVSVLAQGQGAVVDAAGSPNDILIEPALIS